MRLPAGKLPLKQLQSLLASLPADDPAVIVGPAVGEDAAVIDTGAPDLLVVKSDPITFAAEDAGRYLLAVNGNDLAVMGAESRWLLVTALLPEGIAAGKANEIFATIRQAAAELGVTLVGGHTEITVGLGRPILVGCLLGTVARERLVRTAGARVGDAIVLAGGVAVEGTAILAREHAATLHERGVDRSVVKRAAKLLRDPGISVAAAARALHATGAVHSMHDPTEGGIITALHELAEAAGVGVRVERGVIPILPECRTICDALGLDPLALLASGALLATLDRAEVAAAIERLTKAGIPAACIGEIVSPERGRTFVKGEQAEPLPEVARDELARFLQQR